MKLYKILSNQLFMESVPNALNQKKRLNISNVSSNEYFSDWVSN